MAGMTSDTPRDELEPWLRRAATAWGVRMPTRVESRWAAHGVRVQDAADRARAIADGRASLIEGSRQLHELWRELRDDAVVGDELADLFHSLSSVHYQTDSFPLPHDRVHWNSEALRAIDAEARAFERAMLPGVISPCLQLAVALERELARISEAFFTVP